MAFTVGDLIDGHYRVERRYAGGMGFVYIVRDEVVGKRFAIKQLPEHSAENKVLMERFRREASAWLLLDYHPNIVQAHSFHPRPEGPILILECVDGPSLDKLLKAEKKLSPVQVVRYARQFCQAMNYAHTRTIPNLGVGVLHRDIKPGNILITSTNQIKVTDFGLVKFESSSKLTGEGQFVGTIAYSSPEQLRSADKVTKASDVYSFGAVMYQMLAGQSPFRASNASELFRLIIQTHPLPLTELCPDLDKGLAGAIMRCLEKDAADRFSDFAELEKSLAGMEIILRDRRDWTCPKCGYVTRNRVSQCPVCETPVAGGAQTKQAEPDAPTWNCTCGARVSFAEKACPNCGRSRKPKAPDPTDDDAPLPVLEDLVPLAATNQAETTPQVQQPGETLWPVRPAEKESPSDSGLGPSPVTAARPQTVAAKRLWDPASSQHCLVELSSSDKLLAWYLDRSNYTVGRDPNMRIRLKAPAVAGYHLFLIRLPCGWLAITRQAGARLEVNGWPVHQHLLKPDDVLRIGSTWMAFTGAPAPTDPLPPIPGHWPERVGLTGQTVKSGGSTPTHAHAQRSAVCVFELPDGQEFTTRGEPMRIGSSSLCEMFLRDSAIAPVQALVAWKLDGPHVIDLTGAQIKQKAGKPESDLLLSGGESLSIGSTWIHTRIEGDPQAPARQRAADEATAQRRMALTIVAGAQKGQAAILPPGQPIILGRHSDCELSIASDPYISRRHLQIIARDTQIDAKDLGSRHGFAVGQTTSSDTAIAKIGDVLRVGQTYFLVHYEL